MSSQVIQPAPVPAAPHGTEARGILVPRGRRSPQSRFGRLFPYMDPCPASAPSPAELGGENGPMFGGDMPAPSATVLAGHTFFGQFLDHDITLDTTSSLERQNDPDALENFRTAAFELDSVYGQGPEASPWLYDHRKRFGRLLLGVDAQNRPINDLPRNSVGTALTGDPRNDENLIVAQLHTAFLQFHNAVLEQLAAENPRAKPREVFEEAQKLVRWHYQWIILHEYLPLIVGQDLVDDILLHGRRIYHWEGHHPYMPVEFSGAAFRFGHTQVRAFYHVNDEFAGTLFPDLIGGPAVAGTLDRRVDWKFFFDTGEDSEAQPANRIDASISAPLFRLPFASSGPVSLAERNLARGMALGLPSGQDVAAAMGIAVLSDDELWGTLVSRYRGRPAPLWYYLLKEAEVRAGGEHLGPAGGRIVAEVFLGLLEGDSQSYLNRRPAWKPVLPSARPGDFTLADLVRFAGASTE